ncbi:alpha/beta fold hydrolase [Cytobacillus horneckiae]|uniref:alpha/beta hydrolase n=1 Tax=Cytobacillus horneckiae TaxID=549687 RepID=UPI0039A2F331
MSRTQGVISGAESFFYNGSDTGILIVHGFIGTPQSVKFIGQSFAKLGYTVYAPRLAGHGTNIYDLEKCTYEDWLNSVVEAYKRLKKQCGKVYCIGQSMGGTLTLLLAERFKELAGIILINTALSIPAYNYLKNGTNLNYIDEGLPDIKDPSVYEITYSRVPINAVREIQKLMKLAPGSIKNIECPALCFKSIEDHVVPHENTDRIFRELPTGNKWLRVLNESYHVATMDYEKDRIIEDSHEFIQWQQSYLNDDEIGGCEVG